MLTRNQFMERHNYYSDDRVISAMAGETSEFLKDGIFQWSFFSEEYIEEGILEDIHQGDWEKSHNYIASYLGIPQDLNHSDWTEESQKKFDDFFDCGSNIKILLVWLKMEWSEFSGINIEAVMNADSKDLSMPEFTANAKWEICHVCDGNGMTVNPSIDCGGITQSQWEDEWDYEERERYMSGGYDVTCQHCKGSGKVHAYHYPENSFLAWCADKHAEACQGRWDDAAERAAELRMGC